jgi:hypothetical protein
VLLAIKLRDPFEKLMFPLLLALIAFYFIGNTHFYPSLLKYQSGNEIGKVMREKAIPEDGFAYLDKSDHALDFYYGKHVNTIYANDTLLLKERIKQFGKIYVIADKDGMEQLKSKGFTIVSQKEFPHFRVQFLTINFLLPSKRDSSVDKRFVLEIN